MKPLVIIGAGGFGRESLDVVQAINEIRQEWEIVGILDDAPSTVALERLAARRIKHLGGMDWLEEQSESLHVVIGVGAPGARRSIDQRLRTTRHHPATIVHPTAVLGSAAEVGEGSVICAGVQVSTNVRLGRHVHLNPNATIGHDTQAQDYASVNPGAIVSGDVWIGEGVLVGAGAVVLQGLRIGADSVVGAAACVTRDVKANRTVKGIPAQ